MSEPANWTNITKPRIEPGDEIPIDELSWYPFRNVTPEQVINGFRKSLVTDEAVLEELKTMNMSLKIIMQHLTVINSNNEITPDDLEV